MKKLSFFLLCLPFFIFFPIFPRVAPAPLTRFSPSGRTETSSCARIYETPLSGKEREQGCDEPQKRIQKTIVSDHSADRPAAGKIWNTSDADVSCVDAERKLTAFTFDDAPDSTMRDLMAVFNEFNRENPACRASATFFVNGIRVNERSEADLKAAFLAGFELGNHTWSHKNLTVLSPQEIRKEIDGVDELLEKIDGKKRHLIRVPYGRADEKVQLAANAPLIDWAVDTEDWKRIPAEKIREAVLSALYPGAIVLMHDGYPHTVDAVKELLPFLKKEGYQVVGVSQLSRALGCPFTAGKIYTHVKQ